MWGRSPSRATSCGQAIGLSDNQARCLRPTADRRNFGILTGGIYKEFAPYHLPDESFVYLLLAMKEAEHNARRVIDSPDWRMYLLSSADVEREVFRLHQFRRLSYEAAGTLATLDLPADSPTAYAEELVA